MKHMALARKWRPKKFSDIIGQTLSVTVLKNILHSQRLHHAYLLTGTRGVGKTTIARIIAKALNCLELQENEPCGNCNNCKQIDGGRFVDIIEIDAASNTGVDNIRDLIDVAQYTPGIGKYKVYIIDEAHMLSKSAFNAMLKTLEEPPSHVIFILATTDPQKVPVTILSRCLQLKLRHLAAPEISTYLAYILEQENIEFEIKALEMLATSADGSMRDALSLLDQGIAFTNSLIKESLIKQMLGIADDKFIFEILTSLANLDSIKLTETAQNIYNQGYDLEHVLQNLSKQLCNISLIQLTGQANDAELKNYAELISINDIQLYFEIANLGLEQIAKVNDKYPVFIMTLLRMLAFNIGTQNKKEIILQQTNYTTVSKAIAKVDDITIPATATDNEIDTYDLISIDGKLISSAATDNKINITTPDDDSTQKITNLVSPVDNLIPNSDIAQFNGDWFELIAQLKPNLGLHLYPFIENTQLVSYDKNRFNLLINHQYETILNEKTVKQLEIIFSTFFNTTIKLEFKFADNLTTTLKEKFKLEKQEIQANAEQGLSQDANLNKILERFSAKIISGSIKPI